MTLGDLGADVWKIENPVDGDESRTWKPPAYAGGATYFLAANRNKTSLAVDFKSDRGRALVRDLAARADVLVENYLTGSLARFGLDYDSLAAINPRLIYCSISGYGRTGPLAARAGYDFLIQAESGLMAITGDAEGAPQKVGVAICDVIAGQNATQAILAALYARERTGRGQSIDIALYDSAIAALVNVATASLNTESPAKRYGNAHASIVPYQSFAAHDGMVVVACGNNRQFRDLCERVIGRPELPGDPRFATNALRVQHRETLVPMLAASFAALTVEAIVQASADANVPVGPIRSVEDALAASVAGERGMIATMPNGARIVASPLRFSETPVREASAPPDLGGGGDALLGRVLGYDAETIAELRTANVIR